MDELNKREIIESIKFFGSVASTNGIAQPSKDRANDYILNLLEALAPEVQRITAEASGIKIVTNEEEI